MSSTTDSKKGAKWKAREFRQKDRTGRVHRWIVTLDGNTVSLTDGLLDGKLKEPTTHIEKAVNVGKANESSPEEQARLWAERQVKLKRRKGYREVDKQGRYMEDEVITKMNFNDIPENFRAYKPQNSMNSYLQKMMDEGTAWWVRKRNGCMAIMAVGGDHTLTMYSSTLQQTHKDEDIPWIERYPQFQEAIEALDLPPRTVLLGELCCVVAAGFEHEGLDRDDLDYVNGVRGSLTQIALDTQVDHGKLGFCVWDILSWNGEFWVQTTPYSDRMARIIELVGKDKTGYLTFPEIATVIEEPAEHYWVEISSPNSQTYRLPTRGAPVEKVLLQYAKEMRWEGWVVVDPTATYGDKAFNFRGKAERPKECAKLKPKLEADFIVRYDPTNGIGVPGKGSKKVGVGSVFCYLWDPEKREEVYVGKCGGGLSAADVVRFANPKLYPMVWHIEFSAWTKDGSFQFPELGDKGVRDDKTCEECTIDQRPAPGEDSE